MVVAIIGQTKESNKRLVGHFAFFLPERLNVLVARLYKSHTVVAIFSLRHERLLILYCSFSVSSMYTISDHFLKSISHKNLNKPPC
jgi:hypothetical protein